MARKFDLESDVVRWLVTQIQDGLLLDEIDGRDSITALAGMGSQENFLPAFGIDHFSRRASADAAANVLEHLGSLEIISVDTSISLTTGEVLRPDILCFNQETRTLVVFEVKRATDTERQTVTELAGYEQELRNAAPFLGTYDVLFVVVAANWSPLLTHAVGNMNAWSGKQYLGLKIAPATSGFRLTVEIPEAWHLTGALCLPGEALPSIDLYLWPKDHETCRSDDQEGCGAAADLGGVDDASRYPARIVLTAMEMIAREGDRTGAHGFMMLWRDAGAYGSGCWCLTLTTVDPYAMSAWATDNGLPQRSSEATQYFRSSVESGSAPRSLYGIARAALTLLRESFETGFESDLLWAVKAHGLRQRAVPVRFDFWGSLGRYAREFVANPAVRQNYMPFISASQLDWTDPVVGMTLVSNLTAGSPFPNGLIGCEEAFAVGRTLGDLGIAAHSSSQSHQHAAVLEPMLEWSQLEAVRYGVEMLQMSNASIEVVKPMPTLSNRSEQRLERLQELVDWVALDLIGSDHPAHQACFEIGFSNALLFDWIEDGAADPYAGPAATEAAKSARRVLEFALKQADGSQGQAFKSAPFLDLVELVGLADGEAKNCGESVGSLTAKLDDQRLLESFASVVLPGIDSIIPRVMHTVRAPFHTLVDWDYLKSGVRALFESGVRHPAVLFAQDGTIGTGQMSSPFNMGSPVADPSVEVYVLDMSAASAIAIKMTWDKVEEFHAKRSTRS
ncbi:hypothetical protein [Xanthomonas euvesicatoria]|uniref:hypothetical protein n=1 Tax=Xanthomonas euvesicatoria TaxID=456327 RepID=UPI001E5133F0|nr:hypothetical protein [Xanthomonas euvesicatoria]MCC8592694.1 hypothetical protein [Xanthomonas euvesicatoria pv. euvesicatoria]